MGPIHLFSFLLVLSTVSAGRFVPEILKEKPLPRIRTRIIDGDVATQGQFPFIVSVQTHGLFGSSHVCGATLLNENHVLTAAQCVKGHSKGAFNVVAGEQNLKDDSGDEQTIKSEDFFMNDFSTTTGANDVAIIRTKDNFVFVEGLVEAVPLPEDYQEPAEGSMCTAIGWGYTEVSGHISDDLRFVEMPYVTDDECRTIYDPDLIMIDSLCAGSMGGKGVCTGDGGGPLMCDGVQAGIISWGHDCVAYPAVFAQVSHFLDWIRMHQDA